MPYLCIFERNKTKDEKETEPITDHIILVGANRMGEGILQALLEKKEKVIVVDFDPDIIENLNKGKGLPAGRQVKTFFGDITDPEIQEMVNLPKASLIILTVSDPDDTLLLLKNLKHMKIRKPKVIAAAFEKEDAKDFYKLGADYVIMPHIAGGHHLAEMLVNDNRLELIEKYASREKSLIA